MSVIEDVVLDQISEITNTVSPGALGNTGGIHIDAGTLSILDGSLVDVTTLGEGNVGTIVFPRADLYGKLKDGFEISRGV